MKTRSVVVLALILAVATATPLAAPNKEHLQLVSELRLLQEQNQQLRQIISSLTDTLQALNAKIDEQGSVTRKAFADSRVMVDGVAEGVRLVREKIDDTNVRISSVSQEVEALRLAIPQTPYMPGVEGATEPGAAVPGGPPTGTSTPSLSPGVSPQRLYDTAWADYAAGQWALAIQGFETYVKMFPRSPMADDAQFNIGQAYYFDSKFDQAVAAFTQVVQNYPGTNAVPDALYKMGQAYGQLGREDEARQAFQRVSKEFPESDAARLARQQLERRP